VRKKKQTLYERLAKCYMHLSEFDKARGIINQISDKNLRDSILDVVEIAPKWSAGGGNAPGS